MLAIVLCRTGRTTLDEGRLTSGKDRLCGFNPLHGPAHDSRELPLYGERKLPERSAVRQ
ncbi:hypothetical protein GCM10009780_73960 [Actinomadura alba]